MTKKLSTEEILKMARKQTGSPATQKEESADPPPATGNNEVANQAAESKPSTAEILARAKSQATQQPAVTPKTTADILAAARAKKVEATPGQQAVPPQAEATRPEVVSGSPQVAASVSDMVKAIKGEAPAGPAAVTQRPPLPTRPQPKQVPLPTRRGAIQVGLATIATAFASPLNLAWTTLAAMAGAWTLAIARYMFPNVLVEPPTKFKIGAPSDYPPGSVSTKWTAARGIWVVHTDQYQSKDVIYALATVCTHLGCTPSWLDGEQKFKCPCHGSGFYITGINFEGPAPRPLERVGLRLAPDGMLEVDKSIKFQEEKGQWQDGKSYVEA